MCVSVCVSVSVRETERERERERGRERGRQNVCVCARACGRVSIAGFHLQACSGSLEIHNVPERQSELTADLAGGFTAFMETLSILLHG